MTTPLERPLGACEAFAWFASRVCRYNAVCIAEVEGPLTPEALRAALDALPSRHPLLRARVEWDATRGGHARFVACDRPLDLRVVHGAELEAVVEAELDAAFPPEGPLARFVLLQRGPNRSDVVFVFHHVIGDGVSGTFVLRDVIEGAAACLDGQPVRYEPLAPHDCLERHLPPPPGWLRRLWGIVKVFVRILWGGPPRQVPHDAKAPVAARRTRYAALGFDGPFASALAARARAERSSVYGALVAAVMLAIAAEFPGKRSRMNCGTPVNVRPSLVPPVGESLGLFVALTPVVVDVDAAPDFWNVARSAKSALVAAIDRADHLTIASFLGTTGRIVERLARGPEGARRSGDFIEATGTPTFTMSNLGAVPVACEYGPLTWRALGALAGGTLACHFAVVAATLGDSLRWTFVWTDPLVGEERARRLIDRARAALVAAVDARDATSAPPPRLHPPPAA